MNQLQGGDDDEGSSTTGLGVSETRLARVWRGTDEPRITDRDDLEVDVMLDANYSKAVKDEMVLLAREREDCIVMRDLGFQPGPGSPSDTNTTLDTANGVRKAANDNTVHCAYWSQDFRVYDRYSGKNVRVTTPYLLSSKIPQNDRVFGFYRNFVGRGAEP